MIKKLIIASIQGEIELGGKNNNNDLQASLLKNLNLIAYLSET